MLVNVDWAGTGSGSFPFAWTVLSAIERHTVTYAFAILKLGWQRWSWGALFSPSALFCLHVIVALADYRSRLGCSTRCSETAVALLGAF
jgi:hypothetical protein